MAETKLRSITDALARAEAYSPYLRRLMARFPGVVDQVASGDFGRIVPRIDPELPIGEALRLAKGELALCVAIGDLAGQLSLEQVTHALSDFADVALDHAIADAIKAHIPGAPVQGFAVIALGKHGSRELNYSSDIDPILIFDPQTLPCREREEPGEAAVRIGRRVIETMQARTEHGYVMRVDLRLRPSPEVTPIVLPIEAAISYYESQALTWERAAFIRSRPASGDIALGEQFLSAIQPFIWRRGLDFGAIAEIRSISHRIRDHHGKGQAFGPGFDLKRGRGGIRECEFFAQIHQLIHGGREPELRTPSTRAALAALSAAGRIDQDDAAILSDAYTLYRCIEHRLQMVDDQQTHSLPADPAALDRVALLGGMESGSALLAALLPYTTAVGLLYDALDNEGEAALPVAHDQLEAVLAEAGFPDPPHALAQIAHWRSGTVRAVRSDAARAALEAILPRLIEALGSAADPTRAINQLATLIERLPSAINLFRLLEAQPALLRLLISILIFAPVLSEALSRRADLLDRLIDASAFDPPGSVLALTGEMQLDANLEAQLDQVRRVVADHRFALGVQLIEGSADPLDVAQGYARVAEAAITVVADTTIAEFERSHGKVPGCSLIILALGRMGGGELTHASDLDLIYLFSGSFDAESDGPKPLGAVHYFNRLAQRVTAGLSVATSAGALYEVDLRLRPSGSDGPIAVSVEGFERYQAENAWTWEHMALTRARTIYGPKDADLVVAATLAKRRDPAALVADAAKMRADVAVHKPAASPLDVKLCSGGLVDLEFAVHVTQLRTGIGIDPHLGRAVAALVEAGLFPSEIMPCYQILTRLLVTLRLVAPDLLTPDPATCALIARCCGAVSWRALLEQLTAVRQSVAMLWDSVKGE